MKTIKLTYTLELEVPEDALLVDGDAFAQEVRRMLRWNQSRGWQARLRRLVGVDKGNEKALRAPTN